MRITHGILALLIAGAMTRAGRGADLAKIDRTIVKEPVYKSRPKYCLLVFGPAAKTRVWLAVDGDVLYADRNGNGDLTEKGERYAGAKDPGGMKWKIGDIVEADGRTRHTDLRVWFERGAFLLFLRTADGIHQEVGNEFGQLQFSERAENAPIVHLAGPLTFLLQPSEKRLELIPGKEAHFIALIGTAGLGEGTAASSHIADFGRFKMVLHFPPKHPMRTED
jgi:hypothetical protein